MFRVLVLLTAALSSLRKSLALQLENLALRHPIGIFQRPAQRRPTLGRADRFFLDLAVQDLERLAICVGDRETVPVVTGTPRIGRANAAFGSPGRVSRPTAASPR